MLTTQSPAAQHGAAVLNRLDTFTPPTRRGATNDTRNGTTTSSNTSNTAIIRRNDIHRPEPSTSIPTRHTRRAGFRGHATTYWPGGVACHATSVFSVPYGYTTTTTTTPGGTGTATAYVSFSATISVYYYGGVYY